MNLVPVTELSNQHLMREYRELPRIFSMVAKAIERGEEPGHKSPPRYTIGTGQTRFFYDKLTFIRNRQVKIVEEMKNRGWNPVAFADPMSVDHGIDHPGYWNDYQPSESEIQTSRWRLASATRMASRRVRPDRAPPPELNEFLKHI